MNRQHKLSIAIVSISLLHCFRSGALLAQSRNGSLTSNAPSTQPAQKLVETWISKDATYKLSSKNAYHEPLPAFLTGEEGLHLNEFAFHTAEGVKGGYVTIDLGKPYPVSKIWIEFRRHGEAKRAKGLSVWLSNAEGKKGDKVWTAEKFAPEWTVEVKNVQARFVTIGLPDTLAEPLHLAHAKVFAMLPNGLGQSELLVAAASASPVATTQPLPPVVQRHATPELIAAYRASQITSVEADIKAISGSGGKFAVLDNQIRAKRKQFSQLIDAPDQSSARSSRKVENKSTDNVDAKRQLQADIKDLQSQQADLTNQVRDLNVQKADLQQLPDAKIAVILNEQFRLEAIAAQDFNDSMQKELDWERSVDRVGASKDTAEAVKAWRHSRVEAVLKQIKTIEIAGGHDALLITQRDELMGYDALTVAKKIDQQIAEKQQEEQNARGAVSVGDGTPTALEDGLIKAMIKRGTIRSAKFVEYVQPGGFNHWATLPAGRNELTMRYDFEFVTQGGLVRDYRGYIVIHTSNGGWEATHVNIDGQGPISAKVCRDGGFVIRN